MTVLGAGANLRNLANRGMSAVAKAEQVEENQRLSIEMQETAQDNATLGTGAGIGAQYGLSKVMAAKTAATAAGTAGTAGATTAAGAAGATGAATGTMATLGAIAAPVAIGLGVAFLLNKLFD